MLVLAHTGRENALRSARLVISRLAAAGITRIEALGQDTYTQADRFYSYRRATHRGEPGYGRQISIVGLAG